MFAVGTGVMVELVPPQAVSVTATTESIQASAKIPFFIEISSPLSRWQVRIN
jgi:hypothetical protein